MKLAELESIITGLKAGGLNAEAIKRTLANILDTQGVKWEDKLEVPKFGDDGTTVVETVPMSIKDIVNSKVSDSKTVDPNENWEEAKTEAAPKIKSKEMTDKLEADRQAAVPENQKRSAEEQARITEGYQNEINPDISEGGKDALYADLDKAKDAGFIKQVENNVNLLAGKNNDTDFANKVLAELLRSKNADKDFSHSLSQNTLVELAKRFPNTKTKEGKTVNNIKPILDSLKETYDHDTFGLLKAKLNMVHSQGNTAANRLAREVERVNEANDAETGSKEATAKAVKPGNVMRREGVTAFDKAFAGGTEADAAKKALAQDVNAYDVAFSNDPELAKQVRQSVSEAEKPTYSVEDWLKYFEEHPDVRFHNKANVYTINNGVLNLTAINKDADGKEVMEGMPLIKETDVTNFLQALQQSKIKPEVKTEFTNLSTKNTDATEDSPRNQKYVERFNRMFKTGDKFGVYADPRLSKKTVRDENGFVTEYDRDPKKASGSNIRNADYFNQLAGIMRDPKNMVPKLVELITAQHGKDAAAKAQNLYNDVTELNSVFGPVLTGDSIDPSTLRSFAGKFNRLRRDNPNMSLTDIFNKGDVSDVFGIKVHPKFVGNDKFSRLDLLKAALKLAKYKKDAAKEGIDFDALRSDLDDNIKAYKNSVTNNDFSSLPEGVDADIANEVLGTLNTVRSYVDTPAEREAKLRGMFVDAPNKDDLKSLKDEAPEEYEKAEAEYKNAMNEYALAKKQQEDDPGSVDFDVLNMLRKDVEKKRSKADYLKNTKVDILKRAEESGKSYQEVLEDYLHPDWDEDDMELNIQKMLAEYDLMDELKASAGGNIHNSNVKATAIADALDKLSGVDPRFEKWRDKLNSWSRPVAASQLMSSPTTAGMIGVTPAEWSAYSTNKGFFDSDTEQKRRNTTLTGQRKSAKGIAGADTLALNKFAQQLQDMDYTNDTAGKQRLHDELHAENDKLKDPYTRDKDIEARLANAIRGVLADRPEEN